MAQCRRWGHHVTVAQGRVRCKTLGSVPRPCWVAGGGGCRQRRSVLWLGQRLWVGCASRQTLAHTGRFGEAPSQLSESSWCSLLLSGGGAGHWGTTSQTEGVGVKPSCGVCAAGGRAQASCTEPLGSRPKRSHVKPDGRLWLSVGDTSRGMGVTVCQPLGLVELGGVRPEDALGHGSEQLGAPRASLPPLSPLLPCLRAGTAARPAACWVNWPPRIEPDRDVILS